MIQIDIPLAFAAGAVLADAGQRQFRLGRAEYFYRGLALNNAFQIFGLGWIPVYLLQNYFGWETTHMWWTADTILAYPLFMTVAVLLLLGVGNVGFLVGYRLVRGGQTLANRLVYLAMLLFVLGWVSWFRDSALHTGTYSDYRAGQAQSIFEDCRFLWAAFLSGVSFAGGLAVTAYVLWRDGRHLDVVRGR